MIIVTGTKRSGTSMWMQILKAAGYAIVGEAFPRNWADTIRAGNRLGFYESPLRRGIYYATNPDPHSGEYLCPLATQRVAVKVFVPGLLRTELRFVHRVIATIRPWQEYKHSVERLYRIENQSRAALRSARGLAPSEPREPCMRSPVLAWWNDNYGLLRDAALRRYPLHLVSYARVLARPGECVEAALAFLGAGDPARAIAQIHGELRTQYAPASTEFPEELDRDALTTCDELYQRVHAGIRLDAAFFARLDRTHLRLLPRLRADHARVQALRRTAAEWGRALPPKAANQGPS
ncbi:MAG: hypothetical protein QM778_09405 [Myxococcales bacterium]